MTPLQRGSYRLRASADLTGTDLSQDVPQGRTRIRTQVHSTVRDHGCTAWSHDRWTNWKR